VETLNTLFRVPFFHQTALTNPRRMAMQKRFGRHGPKLVWLLLVLFVCTLIWVFVGPRGISRSMSRSRLSIRPLVRVRSGLCNSSGCDAGTVKDRRRMAPPCFFLNDSSAAVLNTDTLAFYQTRQADTQHIYDWFQLTGSSRGVLQQVTFAIPKVVHQVWLGDAPPPSAWLDTWR
jgi:hypothetical protein